MPIMPKPSAFAKQTIKNMSIFNRSIRAEKFPIKSVSKTFNEVDDYERHVCRNGWKQVYRANERRRERV